MYHYVYLLTFPDGMMYVGCRSTKLKPELDTTYLGSGRNLPKDRHSYRNLITKDILGEFSSREEALEFESNYIIQHDCVKREDFYNKRVKVFDRVGLSNPNPFNKTLAKKASATYKSRNYKGANRTPAQKEADKLNSLRTKGTKNPKKGHKGTTNCAFNPWYYITPEGNYVEVLNTTKEEYAKLGILPFTYRQLAHRFHYTNEHKQGKCHPFKGWVFGNLPRPKEMDME